MVFNLLCTSTQTHQLLRERATECYENCCDEGYPLADADGGSGILFSIYKYCKQIGTTKRVLAKLTLPQRGFVGQALRHSRQAAGLEVAPPSVLYGHNFIEVRCHGSRMASLASRYYRKGHFCDQCFTTFTDHTECVYDREAEAS